MSKAPVTLLPGYATTIGYLTKNEFDKIGGCNLLPMFNQEVKGFTESKNYNNRIGFELYFHGADNDKENYLGAWAKTPDMNNRFIGYELTLNGSNNRGELYQSKIMKEDKAKVTLYNQTNATVTISNPCMYVLPNTTS